jgi:signal transduction histidine kinase
MRRRATRIASAIGLATCVSAAALPVYGVDAFVECVEILAPLGAITALLADTLASGRTRIGGLRRQIGLLAAIAVTQLAVAVALFVRLMVFSARDAFFMALVVAYAALAALAAARLLSRRALADLDAVSDALHQVGEGRRGLTIDVHGGDELAALAADVEAMAAKLEAEERARRQLVIAVSHDLRTPIASVQLIAEALADGVFEPMDARPQLDLMSTHIRALASLIDELFELTRLEAGDIPWSLEHVPVDDLLLDTVDAMGPHAHAVGLTLRVERPGGELSVHANPAQIQRVLFNLIHNAIRHTPRGGHIAVHARRRSDTTVQIDVRDDGEGIADDDRERVFAPFARGSNGASGLGLAIARAVVEAHGGRIWAAPSPRGAHVCFTLISAESRAGHDGPRYGLDRAPTRAAGDPSRPASPVSSARR